MAITQNAAALVVGIDHYDDSNIPVLSGSVYDATIAVDWLLKTGLDPGRIHLHMSPLPAESVSGVQPGAADFDSIVASFDALSHDGADRLFVFLSGHGLCVPGASGGPVFLARDYGSGSAKSLKNLRMQGFIQWMLSWRFREQFLFYDACQNPSTSVGRVSLVKAVDPPMLDALPVAPAGGLLACFSASPGQKAWAGAGKGVLMRHVIEQMDPAVLAALPADAQEQDAIIYDWATGSRQLDLRPLFENIIAPAITAEAGSAGNVQNPVCQPYGLAAATYPILDLPPEVSSDLSISVVPPDATAAVDSLRLSVQVPARRTYLPPAGKPLDNPSVCKGPAAAEVFATCRTKPGAAWRVLNSPQRVTLGSQPSVIAFTFEASLAPPPSGPINAFNIRVTGPDGSLTGALTGHDYTAMVAHNNLSFQNHAGISVEPHETGPDIGFDARIASANALAASSAKSWLRAIRGHLSDKNLTATLYPPGTDPNGRAPNVRFVMAQGGAARLAGFLVDQPAVSLTPAGDETPSLLRSVAEIERHPMEWAEAGAYRLTIDLPWGRWSRLVAVQDDGAPTNLEVPGTIGREPLRNAWLLAGQAAEPPALDRETAGRVAPRLAKTISLVAQVTAGDDRVEPFSRTALPEWDMLFSAGRLDQVDEARIRQLASAASPDLEGQERDLLLLGLGHAAFAQGRFDALRVVLAGVTGTLVRNSFDHAVLCHLLRVHDGEQGVIAQAEKIMHRVQKFDCRVAVPIILRWTAGLLVMLFAEARIDPPDWLTQLSDNSLIAVRNRASTDSLNARLSAATAASKGAAKVAPAGCREANAGDSSEVKPDQSILPK